MACDRSVHHGGGGGSSSRGFSLGGGNSGSSRSDSLASTDEIQRSSDWQPRGQHFGLLFRSAVVEGDDQKEGGEKDTAMDTAYTHID